MANFNTTKQGRLDYFLISEELLPEIHGIKFFLKIFLLGSLGMPSLVSPLNSAVACTKVLELLLELLEFVLDVQVFWSFHDELAVENGIIFEGKQVLIPESLRAFLPNSISLTKALGRYVTTFQNIPLSHPYLLPQVRTSQRKSEKLSLFCQPNDIVSDNTSQYIGKPCTVVPGLSTSRASNTPPHPLGSHSPMGS